jgi:hypothetical protein
LPGVFPVAENRRVGLTSHRTPLGVAEGVGLQRAQRCALPHGSFGRSRCPVPHNPNLRAFPLWESRGPLEGSDTVEERRFSAA